ncbi:type II toxin-antitoxin system VapC family toxin [Thermithiobacillus plumbiphilus]|uniref:Type II toxin-antitoxin system VapC family toxin n=1 Tax=Thermithiobacillus plumbiphilus TaxID=1729899 RepID=A0ABU9DBL0_9PROT
MILYLDTSALLKLYVDEPESSRVREAVSEANLSATHLLSYAEMRAGLAKALRMKRIGPGDLAGYRQSLERDWRNLEVVIPTEALIRRAGDLAEQYGLRGYDSVHLSAAEAVWHVAGTAAEFRMVVFDNGLREAAVAMGMSVLE